MYSNYSLIYFDAGFSVPRNKEIMRIFKDVDLVEQLGSGVPRILKSYGKECFEFSDNFLRMTFQKSVPDEQVTAQVTAQDTAQVKKLLSVIISAHNRAELMKLVDIEHREYFRKDYLKPAIDLGLIELTIPEKPKSRKQKYRLTDLGKK